MEGPEDSSSTFAWRGGGDVVAYLNYGLNAWELVHGRRRLVSEARGASTPVFSHYGNMLYAGGVLLSWPSLQIVGVPDPDDTPSIYAYWSPSDKYIAFSNNTDVISMIGVRVWSLSAGKMVWDTGVLTNRALGDGRPGAWTGEDTIAYARPHAICDANMATGTEDCLVIRECAVKKSVVWLSSDGGVMGDASIEEANGIFQRNGLATLPLWKPPSWSCTADAGARTLCDRRALWNKK